MAKLVGNPGTGPSPFITASDVYSSAINNDQYTGLILNTGPTGNLVNGGILKAKMTRNKTLSIVDGTLWDDQIFSANFYNQSVYDIAFSADKTYCCVLATGTLRFFKLNTTTGKYDELTKPTNTLTGTYNCDMSDDGQHAALISASSPYIEFYHRSGDTWTKCTAAISGTMSAIGSDSYYTGRIFDGNNIAHVSNNGTGTIGFQTLTYNSSTNGWVVTATSGLGTVGHNGLDYCYDGTNYYYIGTDISSPYVSMWKTSDGINFTDLSANITNKVNYQHYEPVWDPTGTYCFMNINNASHAFGVYKRDGDNLNYLGPSAFDQFPASAAPTSRNTTTWSPDSKYIVIPSGSSYLSYMYERIGDNFYFVSMNEYNTSTTTPNTAMDRLFSQVNMYIYKFHWL